MNAIAINLVNRAATLTGAYGTTRTRPERVDALALASLTVELINQELELFLYHCYQTNEQGRFVHILADGQLCRGNWCPWGSSGKSQLTRRQRDTVRSWLFLLAEQRLNPLWRYYPHTRRWHVNLVRYPTQAQAMTWFTVHQLNPTTWLNLSL
jgi:hypothetical protein